MNKSLIHDTLLCLIVLSCIIFPADALPATLNIHVRDAAGNQVKDAVVYTNALDAGRPQSGETLTAIMDQQNKEFIPYVLPVLLGTAVHFPNKDDIRHHVYSLSPAKKFELPLYKGRFASPVIFDKPGVVVLGCNIHDWMIAYIFVLKTPYFATTGENGGAEIHNLPPGLYEVLVWHPQIQDFTEATVSRISLSQNEEVKIDFNIKLKTAWRILRTPSAIGASY